ncbi:hypothetical protein J6590_108721 [Homalodisca vitripennis]|nr:hypothetical protein J6590_108721 [Homalodisca vitripennis]
MPIIVESIAPETRIMSDKWRSYNGIRNANRNYDQNTVNTVKTLLIRKLVLTQTLLKECGAWLSPAFGVSMALIINCWTAAFVNLYGGSDSLMALTHLKLYFKTLRLFGHLSKNFQ